MSDKVFKILRFLGFIIFVLFAYQVVATIFYEGTSIHVPAAILMLVFLAHIVVFVFDE